MNIEALTELLGSAPVFRGLPRALRRDLLAKCQLINCKRTTVLQRAGAPHQHLYLVLDGRAEMIASSREGEEIVVANFGPASFSSWIALFHESPAQRDLVAHAGARLLAFPAAAILKLLERRPELYPAVLRHEAMRFRAALDWQQQAMVADRTKRIARLLSIMAQISGDKARRARIAMTGEKLARVAQCSRETLRISLRRLREADLISQEYGAIEIRDIAALRAWSEA